MKVVESTNTWGIFNKEARNDGVKVILFQISSKPCIQNVCMGQ